MTKEAARFNEGKPRFTTIHPDVMDVISAEPLLIDAFARVGGYGASKYDDKLGTRLNYMLGGKNAQEYIDSACRHAFALCRKRELRCPESGQLHMDHIVWNLTVLVAFSISNKCEPMNVPEHIEIPCTSCIVSGDLFDFIHALAFTKSYKLLAHDVLHGPVLNACINREIESSKSWDSEVPNE